MNASRPTVGSILTMQLRDTVEQAEHRIVLLATAPWVISRYDEVSSIAAAPSPRSVLNHREHARTGLRYVARQRGQTPKG